MSRVSFRELIRGCPGKSVLRWLWFQLARLICGIWFKLFYRLRISGQEHMPLTGPVLIVANHQSFLDPVIIGLATGRRPAHMLARSNLFKPFFMGWLLKSLNGVPVERGTADLASMRRCIEILKEGTSLAIFPEGTRTEDGELLPLKAGTLLIARRAGAVILPLAIAGSFEAWPRSRKLPHLFGRVRACFGEPVAIEPLMEMGGAKALEQLHGSLAAMLSKLRAELAAK